MYYHTCPYCGANLDPDERCDCLARIRGKAPKWRHNILFYFYKSSHKLSHYT